MEEHNRVFRNQTSSWLAQGVAWLGVEYEDATKKGKKHPLGVWVGGGGGCSSRPPSTSSWVRLWRGVVLAGEPRCPSTAQLGMGGGDSAGCCGGWRARLALAGRKRTRGFGEEGEEEEARVFSLALVSSSRRAPGGGGARRPRRRAARSGGEAAGRMLRRLREDADESM